MSQLLYTYPNGSIRDPQRTRLQLLVLALEKLYSVEAYLYATTYKTHGDSQTWGQWYKNVADAVIEIRQSSREVRESIAILVGAKLDPDNVQNIVRQRENV